MLSSDNIFQEFKLYIEGVQVPFLNISINQSMGSLPQATITVPPQAGLMDIARFYQPKVHIFFTERDTGIEKVLFLGLIIASTYSKSKEGNSGSTSISFTCVHRYNLITECLVDYSGAIRDNGTDLGGSNAAINLTGQANSTSAVQEALAGCVDIGTYIAGPLQDYSENNPTGPKKNSDGNSRTDVLPSVLSPYANRLVGMPGVFINYWNQIVRDSLNPNWTSFQGVFKYVYKPLIEDGLEFFKRLSGHWFIENSINSDKSHGCGPKGDSSVLIPPGNQIFLDSTVQANLTIHNLGNYLQNSSEVTSIYAIFENFYQGMDYDIITLASPAEVPTDPTTTGGVPSTYAVDTIIKPGMPFYYSPACNILYPSMYTSINVNYDEMSIPTRLDVLNHEDGGGAGALGTHFRSPPSVRDAIAQKRADGKATLINTTGNSGGALGLYEMGRGVKYDTLSMPDWLSALCASSKANETTAADSAAKFPPGSRQDNAVKLIRDGWNKRYNNPEMSPWDTASGIKPHQIILFTTADYYYTKKFASTKAGNISCLFNPYIIPGYPMDVMESSPNLPSFHGLCVAVSHNISASGLSTQVSMAAAMTYTELANYYIPFVNPYLEVALGLAANPTLVNTDDGAALGYANKFYHPTLGVTAVTPETLFDFTTGQTRSTKMSGGMVTGDGGDIFKHSFENDLMTMCKRPIESKADFAKRSELSYIDMIPANYSATGVKYKDPKLSSGASTKFEIGQSQFLDYSTEIHADINGVPPQKPTN